MRGGRKTKTTVEEKAKIQQLYQDGYIRESGPIMFLTGQLGASDTETREMAARTIIERSSAANRWNCA